MRSALVLVAALRTLACSYDQNNGASCVPDSGPVGASGYAPGGVSNLGDSGLASVVGLISDFGGNATASTTPAQLAAARALASVCAANGCKAVLSAGNNFRPNGLPAGAAAASARWRQSWQAVYNATAAPWYATGGADDWEGNVTAERALTESSTSDFSWHYPTLWQSVVLVVPPGYSTLQVLLLDTVTLLGSLMARRRLSDFNTPDGPPPISAVQWAWLEAQLAGCTADWLVVVGSAPLYSAGAVGPSAPLLMRLLPLLNASGAALYVGGSDAVAQHFRPTAAAPLLDSIVIGNGAGGDAAAAATLPNAAAVPPGALAWSFGGSAGFATLAVALDEAGEAQLTVSFYGEALGDPLYSFTKNATRRGTLQAAPAALGPHGARSGLLLFLVLASGSAAACGYFAAQVVHPPPGVMDAEPATRAAGRRQQAAVTTPLLAEPGLTAAERHKRFNVFTL
jgi:hypothetical protein